MKRCVIGLVLMSVLFTACAGSAWAATANLGCGVSGAKCATANSDCDVSGTRCATANPGCGVSGARGATAAQTPEGVQTPEGACAVVDSWAALERAIAEAKSPATISVGG
ncbi:MAG: hypothetical protein RSC06_16615, partial [Clostridia bacterium]